MQNISHLLDIKRLQKFGNLSLSADNDAWGGVNISCPDLLLSVDEWICCIHSLSKQGIRDQAIKERDLRRHVTTSVEETMEGEAAFFYFLFPGKERTALFFFKLEKHGSLSTTLAGRNQPVMSLSGMCPPPVLHQRGCQGCLKEKVLALLNFLII